MMNQKLLKYVVVAFACALVFNVIPIASNPIKDMWVFVSVGLLVFYLVDSNGLLEAFDASANKVTPAVPVLKAPAPAAPLAAPIKPLTKEDLLNKPNTDELEQLKQRLQVLEKEQRDKLAVQQQVQQPTAAKDAGACDCEKKLDDVIAKYLNKGKFVDDRGVISNIVETDMRFNQQDPALMQPLGTYDKTFTNKWDHGFTYLSTDRWAPPRAQPPVCKTEKQCPVCPSTTNGYPINLMEFDSSRKVLGPDNISVDYIKERLNAAA
jgi:hypothetical protein